MSKPFTWFFADYVSAMIWDLPAILSALWLNYLLLKELRMEEKENSLYEKQKIILLKDLEKNED